MTILVGSVFPRNLFFSLIILLFCQINSLQSFTNRTKREPEDEPISYGSYAKPNKITFCTDDGERYTFSTDTCKKGAWLPEAFDVNCVCVEGLWSLSENFCDQDFLLLAGDNKDCFEVSKPVRRFVSLYNHNDPADKGKKLFIQSNLENFETFTHSMHTRDKENGSYIIRFDDTRHEMYLRHTEGYQENFWQRCIQASKKPKKFQIVQTNGVTFAETKKRCRDSQDLEYPMKKLQSATWGLSLGQSWHPVDGVGRKSTKCVSTCFEESERRRRQMPSADYNGDSLEAALKEKDIRGDRDTVGEDGTGGSVESNPASGESEKTDTGNEKPDTGNEKPDTGNENTIPEVENGNPPANENKKNSTSESSDEILDPSEERYQKIDRDTSKIAYYLKNWNMKKEPGPKLPYKEYKYLQYARIIMLKTCPEEYVPVGALTDFLRLFRYLVYESLKKSPEHYSEDINRSADKRIIASLESCYGAAQPMQLVQATVCPYNVESVVYNGNTISATLPSHLVSSQDKTDLILETMWKVMLHTHYLCSENFVLNGGDLSTMYMKLQEFLTHPHVMFRWENPGYSSNQVYRILFPSLDFKKFVDGINACLAGAHGVSKYTKWLKRPTSSLQNSAKIMAKKLTKVSASGRSLNSLPTLFNRKGYCTNGYDDPLRWSKYNKGINAECRA